MTSKFIATAAIALAALTGASAFAQSNGSIYSEGGYATPYSVSSVTRAQVQAEYLQARKAGTLPISTEVDSAPAQVSSSSITRAEVRADAVQWVKAHVSDTNFYNIY